MKDLIMKADDAETLAVNSGDFSAVDAVYVEDALNRVHEGVQVYRDHDVRFVGTYADRNHQILEFEESADEAVVTVSLCRNVAGARLVLADGGDITPADRPIEQSMKVTGYFSANEQRLSLFSNWEDGDACA